MSGVEMTARGARAKALRRLAGQVVAQLYVASRVQQLYGGENDNVRRAQEGLFERLRELFASEDELKLHVEDGYLFANEVRLRADRALQEAQGWLLDRFADSGLSSLTLKRDLKLVELRKLIPILATATWPEGGPPPDLARLLRESFVLHAAVALRRQRDPAAAEEERAEVSSRHLAVAIWMKLHGLALRLTGAVARREPPALRPLRVVLQLAVDLLLEGDGALLAMTRLKNHVPEGTELDSPWAWPCYLESHMVNTSLFALALGARLGLTRRELLDLGVAALAADAGMALVPRELREHGGRLTASERAEVDAHALRGAEALLGADDGHLLSHAVALVAATHHPRTAEALTGAAPGLYASIAAVADGYDAMTTERPWRAALPHTAALRDLGEGKGGVHRGLARLFAHVIGAYPAGTVVELTSGEVAVVTEQNAGPDGGARPKVKVLVAGGARGAAEGALLDLAERAPGGGLRRAVARTIDLDAMASSPGDLVALL